jgi:hypothetical protein
MRSIHALTFCVLAGALLCATAATAQEVSPSVRIVDRINENLRVTLRGNTHPSANAKNDRGRVASSLPMKDLVLVLSRSAEQQADFDKFVTSQYDPASANYHQWLEPEEVGVKFGPAEIDIETVSKWLGSHGFTVNEVAKNRLSIRFSGTAGQVESAFHTEIHHLEVNGVRHIGNMSDPQIPTALASAVVGVKALHNFHAKPMHRVGGKVSFNRETGKWTRIKSEETTQTTMRSPAAVRGARALFATADSSSDVIEDVTPYDFATIYNVKPVWNSGINGKGQTIAIAGTSRIKTADLTSFRSTFGLPAVPSFTTIVGNSYDPGQCGVNATNYCTSSDQLENSLDLEWSGAVAPGANLVLVASGYNSITSPTNDPIYDSVNYIIEHKTAPILNVSYGQCELGMGTADNVLYYHLWQTAAAEGIAAFVSSGDSGAAGCDQGMSSEYGTPWPAEYGLTVSGMASTPYNTAVGGTDFGWCPASAILSSSSSVYTCKTAAASYWNTANSSQKTSAKGYIPEIPWNDTCSSPTGIAYAQYWASWVNDNLESVSTPKTAEAACNFFVNWYSDIYEVIYEYYGEEVDLSSFVDTIGGSGGRSNCVASDGSTVASCKSTITTTGTANGSIALYKDGWKKPSWQAGVTGIPADGVRDIPDVSFFAADGMNNSAYLVCDSVSGYSCSYSSSYSSNTAAQEVGGTSVASPAMAGVMALINQKAGAAQGSPNAELYKLAAKQTYSKCSTESAATSSACYFNDIDKYTIAQPCDFVDSTSNCTATTSSDQVGIQTGYSATTGYDLATGLGSLNVANVVNGWSASSATLSATSLSFASTTVGVKAAIKAITLTSGGTSALSGVKVSISGASASSFSQTNTCGTSVKAGASCAITVTFKPAAKGALTASLSIADSATNSPQTVTLSGTGVPPAVTLSAASLSFASTAVGSKAATKAITLTNSGTSALSGVKVSIAGVSTSSFSQTNTCGTSVKAGASCAITVTFKPAAKGALTATLSIADSAANSPQTVALSGTGVPPAVTLSAASLSFASTAVGSKAATKAITLTNSSTAALSGVKVSISGAGASSFSQTNTCGTSVKAGASCAITVTFKPAAKGALTASLSIADSAANSPQTVALSGIGAQATVTLSATKLSFAKTKTGVSAATQKVTLTNSGTAALALSKTAFTLSGTNATSFSTSNTCGTSVAVGGKCVVTVGFKPTKAGALTATLKIANNASNSPQNVTLNGTGY